MKTTEILPIRSMEIPDWDKQDKGLSLTASCDINIPIENSISDQIITYLLNEQLNITTYTPHYHTFYFDVMVYYAGTDYYPEIAEVIDPVEQQVLQLSVHIDAPRFAQVDKHEALRMIAQLMIDKIPQFLFGREDFDGEKFYEDILPIVQPIADGTRTFREEEFPL